MKLFLIPYLVAWLAALAAAVEPQKQVIISWDKATPQHIVDEAKDAVLAAGGVIL